MLKEKNSSTRDQFREFCQGYGYLTIRIRELEEEIRVRRCRMTSVVSPAGCSFVRDSHAFYDDKIIKDIQKLDELEEELDVLRRDIKCIEDTIGSIPDAAEIPFVWLHLVCGYTLQRIADQRGCSRQTAFNHMNRALSSMNLDSFILLQNHKNYS